MRAAIVPPYLLRHLADSSAPIAGRARATLVADRRVRQERAHGAHRTVVGTARPAAGPSREVSDAGSTETLPGTPARSEGAAPTGDAAVDEAYDGFGATWRFYHEVLARTSIDDAGARLLGTVHYGREYQNAFWNGERMVFGDGDGEIFGRFTASLDVIGHELTHGVIERTANLTYSGQSGALNESLSDVFGVLVAQYAAGQDAAGADWLVGADLLLPGVDGVALRNLLHPGTAYDDPRLGTDPQPDHMDRYVDTRDDNGGVHYNSGIPNRAFALAAIEIGGPAWDKAGRVWYDVLTGPGLRPDSDFAGFAELTVAAALARFGEGRVADAVRNGWQQVGVGVPVEPAGPVEPRGEGIDPGAELLLRRTGGLAGLRRERHAALAELPSDDRRQWEGLLASPDLLRLAARSRPVADAFCYGVTCAAAAVDVEVAEPDLPDDLRALFERTLRGT